MATEARKAYEHNMSRCEMVLRNTIKEKKLYLKHFKHTLNESVEFAASLRQRGQIDSILHAAEDNIVFMRGVIKTQKYIIQLLKNGLPQRRPKGVMAKCPFCGAKQWQRERLELKGGWFTAEVPALWAFDNKDDGVVVAKCARCGAMFKMYNQKHSIQDAIDAWNRRAQ